MKINRFMALAAIALLIVGALGVLASRSLAMGSHAPVSQSDACAQDEADDAEVTSAEDTDNVELQCGDQNEADGQEAVSATSSQSDACAQDKADDTEIASAEDTDNVELQCGDQNDDDGQETFDAVDTDNVEEQVGDQSGPDTGVEAPEIEAPAAQ